MSAAYAGRSIVARGGLQWDSTIRELRGSDTTARASRATLVESSGTVGLAHCLPKHLSVDPRGISMRVVKNGSVRHHVAGGQSTTRCCRYSLLCPCKYTRPR